MSARIAIDVQIASRIAGIPGAAAFRRWVRLALKSASRLPAECTMRVVNAAEAHRLNRDFRGKDYATNVLTLIYHDPPAPRLTGDIVMCAQVVAREAREQQKTLEAHYAHLAIHGALHLAGLDHESARDAGRWKHAKSACSPASATPIPTADRPSRRLRTIVLN